MKEKLAKLFEHVGYGDICSCFRNNNRCYGANIDCEKCPINDHENFEKLIKELKE
ncbi:MAG: hypothetical protein GY800_08930 [Planctomycetes bacterium]|nr:hypothetical protein [Planctomycetota bacterium]